MSRNDNVNHSEASRLTSFLPTKNLHLFWLFQTGLALALHQGVFGYARYYNWIVLLVQRCCPMKMVSLQLKLRPSMPCSVATNGVGQHQQNWTWQGHSFSLCLQQLRFWLQDLWMQAIYLQGCVPAWLVTISRKQMKCIICLQLSFKSITIMQGLDWTSILHLYGIGFSCYPKFIQSPK